MAKQDRRYPWWAWTLIWLGSVAAIMVFSAVLLPHLTGRQEDWAVSVPFAVLASAGAVVGSIYGNRRKDRR